MARHGKIARLPHQIREELNRRMWDGELGGSLLGWLNALPEAQAMLARWFDGIAISRQNLCEWRAGGFAEWEAEHNTVERAEDLTEHAKALAATSKDRLTDSLAMVMAVRFAGVLSEWKGGDTTPEFSRNLRVLERLCDKVVRLRRCDLQGRRLSMTEQDVRIRALLGMGDTALDDAENKERRLFGAEGRQTRSK